MRSYSISIMVISVFSLALTLLLFLGEVKDYKMPSFALKGDVYKKYLDFDYFREQELKTINGTKPNANVTSALPTLSYEEWDKRWKEFRVFAIADRVQEARSDMFELLCSFIIFSFLFVGHFIIYKLYEQDRQHGSFY